MKMVEEIEHDQSGTRLPNLVENPHIYSNSPRIRDLDVDIEFLVLLGMSVLKP